MEKHVIRLLPDQNRYKDFSHPLLDEAEKYRLTEKQFKTATKKEQQLSFLWVVRQVVGRYLYHWPISKIWLDEMCSTGMEVICEIEDLTNDRAIMNKLQDAIDRTLNNARSLVRASLSTNKSRSANDEELEYVETVPLHNIGAEDMDLLQAELIDELSPEDQEKFLKSRFDD